MIQMCSSNHLSRKTLSDGAMTLNKMLEVGRAMEMSEAQAAEYRKRAAKPVWQPGE